MAPNRDDPDRPPMTPAIEAEFDKQVLELAMIEAKHHEDWLVRWQARAYLRWRVTGKTNVLTRRLVREYSLRELL